MQIEQLYYFFEVANCASFSKATNKIFTTQQNLSKAISNLEKELGKNLFIRHPQGVKLTPDGLIFYEKVSHLLKNQLKVGFSTNEPESTENFFVNICSTLSVNSLLMPSILQQLYTRYPSLTVKIHEENMYSLLPYISKNNCLGIAFFFNDHFNNVLSSQYASKISFKKIFTSRLGIIVSKNSPLASKKDISLEEAFANPFICNFTSLLSENKSFNIFKGNLIEISSQELSDFLLVNNKAISFLIEAALPQKNQNLNPAQKLTFIPFRENILLSAMICKNIYYPFCEAENIFIATARDITKRDFS